MSASRPPLRVGIIGTGGIAHAHADALRSFGSRVDLVGVVDIDRDRAAAFASRFDARSVYPDATELFANEHLDLVHICTPPQTHAPLAIEAMRAGVPSLVEKPTALSLAEFDQLAGGAGRDRSARAHGVPAPLRRRRPAAARACAAAGELGRPLRGHLRHPVVPRRRVLRRPVARPLGRRGRRADDGPRHPPVRPAAAMLGRGRRSPRSPPGRPGRRDTEDVSMALVRFANGAVATVVNSLVSPRETSRAAVRLRARHRRARRTCTATPTTTGRSRPRPATTRVAGALGGRRDRRPERAPRQLAAVFDALDAGARAAGRPRRRPADHGVRRGDLRVRLHRRAGRSRRARPGRPFAAPDERTGRALGP